MEVWVAVSPPAGPGQNAGLDSGGNASGSSRNLTFCKVKSLKITKNFTLYLIVAFFLYIYTSCAVIASECCLQNIDVQQRHDKIFGSSHNCEAEIISRIGNFCQKNLSPDYLEIKKI